MNEFIRISLHNHFGGNQADRTLDKDPYAIAAFSMKEACEKLLSAKEENYTLLAMTSHNTLHLAEYYLLRNYSKRLGVTLLPGTEIDLRNQADANKYLHVVVVFDPLSDLWTIRDCLTKSRTENQKNCLTFEQLVELAIIGRSIIIAHGVKQNRSGRAAENNPELLSDLIALSKAMPVILEDNKEYFKATLRNRLEDLLNSDELEWIEEAAVVSTADRQDFTSIESPTLMWGRATFDDLYYTAIMGKLRLFRENDVVNKVCYISSINILHSGRTQIQDSTITCSHGLNTIIGPSGGGKTLFLDIIKRKLNGVGLENKTISPDAKYEELYSLDDVTILDKNEEELDASAGYTIVEGENLYSKIIEAYSSDKERLLAKLGLVVKKDEWEKLIAKFNAELNKYFSVRLQIAANAESIKRTVENIDSAQKFVKENPITFKEAIKYTMDSAIVATERQLQDVLNSLRHDLRAERKSFAEIQAIITKNKLSAEAAKALTDAQKLIESELTDKERNTLASHQRIKRKAAIQKMIYKITQSYNNTVGEKAKHVIEREQAIISGLQRLWELIADTVRVRYSQVTPVLDSAALRGAVSIEDNDIANLEVSRVNTLIPSNNLKRIFPKNIGNTPRINASKFTCTEYDFSELPCVEAIVKTFLENGYSDTLDFVFPLEVACQYEIQLKDLDGAFRSIDKITAGTLSKIYINTFLDKQIQEAGSNIIILYDQPDSNMEKTFLLTQLVDKLNELRKQYQLFITTHEPLLVINADSNNIIRATNDKAIGNNNSIRYENYSFAGISGKQSMIDEIAKLIDGDVTAIEKRHTIYKGMRNG